MEKLIRAGDDSSKVPDISKIVIPGIETGEPVTVGAAALAGVPIIYDLIKNALGTGDIPMRNILALFVMSSFPKETFISNLRTWGFTKEESVKLVNNIIKEARAAE